MRYIPSFRSFAFGGQAALLPSWYIDFTEDPNFLWSGGYDYSYVSAKTTSTIGNNVNKNGDLRTWVANEVVFSEIIGASTAVPWTVTLGTTSALGVTSPIGTTAYRFTHNNTSSTSRLEIPDVVNTNGVLRTMSVFLRYVNTQWIWMQNDTGSALQTTTTAAFDILNGTTGGACSGVEDYGIDNIGNGWYRAWIVSRGTANNSAALRFIRCGTGSNPLSTNIAYNGTEAFDVWGAQVNRDLYLPYSTTLSTANGIPKYKYDTEVPYTQRGLYVQEQTTNVLRSNEDLGDTTRWIRTNTSAILNDSSTIDPLGTTGADLLTASDITTNGTHGVRYNLSGAVRNFSVFLKAQNLTGGTGRTGKYAYISLPHLSTATLYNGFIVDLTTGEITKGVTGSSQFSNVFYGVEKYKNGWVRPWITSTSTNYVGLNIALITNDSNGNPTVDRWGETFVAGNTSDGIYVFGGMAVEGHNKPPSYLTTGSGASVTEPADLVHITESLIGSIGDSGAFVLHFYNPLKVGTLFATNNAANSMIGLETGTTASIRAFWTGACTSSENMLAGLTTLQKACLYWEGSSGSTLKFALNGSTVYTGTSDLIPSNISFVSLGARATGTGATYSNYSNVTIAKMYHYNTSLTDTQIRNLTI